MYQLYHSSLLNANKISKKIAFLYREFISLLWKKRSSSLKCLINRKKVSIWVAQISDNLYTD